MNSKKEVQHVYLVGAKSLGAYPQVNQDTCVNCGLCEKVCPISNCETKKNENQVAYLLQYKDDEVCQESTSGGAFTGIASYVIERGGDCIWS